MSSPSPTKKQKVCVEGNAPASVVPTKLVPLAPLPTEEAIMSDMITEETGGKYQHDVRKTILLLLHYRRNISFRFYNLQSLIHNAKGGFGQISVCIERYKIFSKSFIVFLIKMPTDH